MWPLHPNCCQMRSCLFLLDDLYFVCKPNRVSIIYGIVEKALWEHARIRVHTGKTQVWNKRGVAPNGMDKLGAGAWRGGTNLSFEEQGMKILGTPVGHPQYVRKELLKLAEEQSVLLGRIPTLEDTQSAWLLLLFCASMRANYILRVVPPDLSKEYSELHDKRLYQCLCDISEIETTSIPDDWKKILTFHCISKAWGCVHPFCLQCFF